MQFDISQGEPAQQPVRGQASQANQRTEQCRDQDAYQRDLECVQDPYQEGVAKGLGGIVWDQGFADWELRRFRKEAEAQTQASLLGGLQHVYDHPDDQADDHNG